MSEPMTQAYLIKACIRSGDYNYKFPGNIAKDIFLTGSFEKLTFDLLKKGLGKNIKYNAYMYNAYTLSR